MPTAGARNASGQIFNLCPNILAEKMRVIRAERAPRQAFPMLPEAVQPGD
jgi:hypothetical protein